MIKDINGFLWIGTANGLNRFDGNIFKKYFADKTKKNKTITGNDIQGLIEDSLHNIWIGTNKGLSCYDIKADSFRIFFTGIPLHDFFPFWATRDKVFCLHFAGNKENQIASYDIHSFAKKILAKLTPAEADSVGNGSSSPHTIYDAASNSIWMVKGFQHQLGSALLQISLSTGERKEFTWSCYRNIPGHCHFFEGMRFDPKRNSIWINSPDGLLEFTLNDKKFHHIDALNEWVNLKDFSETAGIDIDAKGRIWMGTNPAGILIYNPSTHSVNLPFPDDSVKQQTVNLANVYIYCDRDGMVWSGSWYRKGIYQLIPFVQTVTRYTGDRRQPHELSNAWVRNCINADDGKLWMTTPDGINIFNPNTGLFDMLDLTDARCDKEKLFAIKVDTITKKAWIVDFGTPLVFETDLTTKKCRNIIFKDNNNEIIPRITGFWACSPIRIAV